MTSIHSASWDNASIARFWDYWGAQGERTKYFSMFAKAGITRFLELTGGLHGSLLDYGCGTGHLLEHVLQTHPELQCAGLDFSARSVAEANDCLTAHDGWKGAIFVQNLPTPLQEKFDVVTCIEVIEHLTDDLLEPTLREVARLTKPTGIAFFTTPFNENLHDNAVFCPFCCHEFHSVQHMRSWNVETLTAALKRNDFEVIFCDGIDFDTFQSARAFSLMGDSPRLIIRKSRNLLARWHQKLRPKPFPFNREFVRLAHQGPHLCAVARPLQ